ncbi:MAG TPA: YdeI/OmpD-associated family protein [Bacteroidia bacterium]|nr:YdeI/OmpD-associated family protein [Bacteroidia bacterium]
MELKDGIKTFYPKSPAEWRKWLKKNHDKEKKLCLILYNKDSGVETISWSEAVDEALCFGWIDSKVNKRDEDSRYQVFTPRNPKSNWSKINKDKVARLVKDGLMQPAGMAMVELAKKTGTWDAMNGPENLEVPGDLKKVLAKNKTARNYFEAFPNSAKKSILGWILSAKRPETRQKRIEETVAKAEKNVRAFP